MATPTSYGTVFSVAQSGNYRVDALLESLAWGGAIGNSVQLSYSFSSSSSYYYTPYSSADEPFSSYAFLLTASQKTAARLALAAWAEVANVTFSEVTDSASVAGDIRLGGYSNQSTSYAYSPGEHPAGGDVWIGSVVSKTSLPPGGYDYETFLHELGHALGLKHPGDYAGGGDATPPFLPTAEDSRQYSVMSYNRNPHDLFRDVTPTQSGYSWSYSYVYPSTPMPYDIAAMQYLYGANSTTRAGNDTYSFDTATPFFKTIWDGGGTDTISVSNFSNGCTIDLREGAFSSIAVPSDTLPAGATEEQPNEIYDGQNNLAIAYGCVIENATGGSGNDSLTGNSAANELAGGTGNDSLTAAAGNDILFGQDGNDILSGGSGYNLIVGGSGTDILVVDSAAAQVSVRAIVSNLHLVRDGSASDVVRRMETLRVAGTDSTMAVANDAVNQQLAQIYTAAFARAPELSGYNYWESEVATRGIQGVADIIFSLSVVKAVYPDTLSNSAFVDAIYQNVFDRPSDSEGNAYWVGEMTKGMSRGKLVLDMTTAALGTVDGTSGKAYFENRLDTAKYAVVKQQSSGSDRSVSELTTLMTAVDGEAVGIVGAINTIDAWV